tara:strand:- start:453 stop:677 length:225 start_codon:yes stop_codon:yes gene_type:complete
LGDNVVSNYKKAILEATVKHLEGHIMKHKMNVEILLGSHVGVAEHPDVMETIEKELDIMAQYHDKLEMVNKYFL